MKVLKPALRGPGPGGRKTDRSRDQIYMPVVLIFMFIVQAIIMIVLIFEWTMVPTIAASGSNLFVSFSLPAHYCISILMTTLTVTLEMRMKSREITKGLVSRAGFVAPDELLLKHTTGTIRPSFYGTSP
jgi:uncharacterized membrane protein YkvI